MIGLEHGDEKWPVILFSMVFLGGAIASVAEAGWGGSEESRVVNSNMLVSLKKRVVSYQRVHITGIQHACQNIFFICGFIFRFMYSYWVLMLGSLFLLVFISAWLRLLWVEISGWNESGQ
jgi:hypothetical protein